MVLTKHRHRHDEAPAPVVRPRGVPARPLAGRPGIAADVLRELRAADAPIPPTALRGAFDRPVHTWLPAPLGMRAVPLAAVVVDDIDTVAADIAAMLIERPDATIDPRIASELDSISAWLNRHDTATDFAAQLAADAWHEQLLTDAYAADRRVDFDNMPSRVAALRTSVAMVRLLSDEYDDAPIAEQLAEVA